MKRDTLFGLLLGIAALLAVACGGDSHEAVVTGKPRLSAIEPITVPAGKPIVIGLSLPLTGPDRTRGEENLAAVLASIELWKEQNGDTIAGHPIHVAVEDDGCTDPLVAGDAAKRLLSMEGLVAVVGPQCSSGATAAIPLFANAGIVSISGSTTQSSLTAMTSDGYFFRTAYRNDLEGALAGLFVSTELGAKVAVVVDDGEAYGLDLADAAASVMKKHGVDVKRLSINRGVIDFGPTVREVLRESPEFVGFAGFNPEAALFYRQLRDAGYTGIFGAGDGAATSDFTDSLGALAEGVHFAACQPLLPDDFVAAFKRQTGRAPAASAFVAHYADAVHLLLHAIDDVVKSIEDGSLTVDTGALRAAIRGTRLPDGISGAVAFDARGDRVRKPGDSTERLIEETGTGEPTGVFESLGLVPCQVQDGRFVNLFGPGAGTRR